MTLLLADFCKLRVSASETRKPGKPFSRAYLPEPHPVKSNASGRGAAVAVWESASCCSSGAVRSVSISPPLRSGSMDGVRRMGRCISKCGGMQASPRICLCIFPHCSMLCQVCIPHQPFVYFFCCFSSFFYGPDYQGLASSHVSGGEYVLNICSVAFSVCGYICPSV